MLAKPAVLRLTIEIEHLTIATHDLEIQD